ncbi:hypothetical protein [Kribbella sp. NPDC051770]|uniref:hypothetical protein n=1 Tax=Kribbella sp. NPDC051770 TaxID=3155413 RepID=UPI00342F8FDC
MAVQDASRNFVPRYRSRDVAALLLIPFGGFLLFAGWVAGVILLWKSDRWTSKEKWLGTLVWPFGYLFVTVAVNYYAPGGWSMPAWLGIPIAVLIALAPIPVLVMLVKNANPGRSAAPRG